MITVEHKNNLVVAAVFGEFTLADAKEFEEAVLHKLKFEGKPNLLLDLADMTGFTVDVAWEDFKFSRDHGDAFERIAVVTGSRWIAWAAWLSRVFVDSEVQVFDDANLAEDWVTPSA